MPLLTLTTTNFQIQFESSDFSGPGELAQVQARAQSLQNHCEADYAVLCQWFGIEVGAGLGSSNRVIITIMHSQNFRGGVNSGYSKNHPEISIDVAFDGSEEHFLGVFVAEMIEILMSYKGPWGPGNSGGEGLSRVAAQLLHPDYGSGFVNAWLAFDPTNDPSAAVADDEIRKDWVSENFTGGPLKAGGSVNGDDDSYSIGCAMLFLYYLKTQLGFSMDQIVQKAGPTLEETYQNLSGGRFGFWAFKSLLTEHFPPGVTSPVDDPFPLSPVAVPTNVGPAAAASGNTVAEVLTRTDQRIFYTWWDLGEGGKGFGEVDGGGQSDTPPAAALVGSKHNYLFVAIKGLDGNILINQGEIGKPFVGWSPIGFQSPVSPGLASSGDTTAIVTVGTDGRIFYDYWNLGKGGRGLTEITGGGRSDAAPAVALVGSKHNYLFVAIKGLDGNILINQGEIGKPFVGWSPIGFQSPVSPGLASSGNTTAIVTVGTDGRIFYDYWNLGHGGRGLTEVAGGGRTNAAPAAALVGSKHDYLFAIVKGSGTNAILNQGEIGKAFTGWQ